MNRPILFHPSQAPGDWADCASVDFISPSGSKLCIAPPPQAQFYNTSSAKSSPSLLERRAKLGQLSISFLSSLSARLWPSRLQCRMSDMHLYIRCLFQIERAHLALEANERERRSTGPPPRPSLRFARRDINVSTPLQSRPSAKIERPWSASNLVLINQPNRLQIWFRANGQAGLPWFSAAATFELGGVVVVVVVVSVGDWGKFGRPTLGPRAQAPRGAAAPSASRASAPQCRKRAPLATRRSRL